MSRNYDPTKARRHWVYARERVCDIFDVGDSTITNWIGKGLKLVDNKRPQLFAGYELRRFITRMRWPYGRPPESGRLFCSVCLGFKALVRESIQTRSDGIARLLMTGRCTDCHNMLQSRVQAGDVAQIFSACANTPRDSSDVIEETISGAVGRNRAPIPPETNSSNLRWLHGYSAYLVGHENFDPRTVDEHLRSVSRMSGYFGNMPFETVTIGDVCRFKEYMRSRRDFAGGAELSKSTVTHTLDRCRVFFTWLRHRPGVKMDVDLPGYFSLSRKERKAEVDSVKGTSLSFDQALRIFAEMPRSSPVELRDRTIVAMFIVTGIRIAALISLRGKHVNARTRWIDQAPREVNTKLGKYIRTYCLDLGSGLLDAIEEWADWRDAHGCGSEAPFFPPDRYLQPNALGLGHRSVQLEQPQCWRSEEPVQRIIKDAARAAGIPEGTVSSHDFRKCLHPFLSQRGEMMIAEEVALQLNLGHTPQEIVRKHYASMSENQREVILNELCRRALTNRSELELYLAYERKAVTEADPHYRRAKEIYERHASKNGIRE
ncbi:MAG: tyrosine-type recombinase/integrase [Rhizobium sp.]|nr:tyrosine-type recombinase/integrase [Rhizobium sp.]